MQIKTNRRSGFTIVEIMIIVAIIALVAAISIPNFVKARENAQLNSIVNNLRITESAKEQWRLDHKKKTGATPVAKDLSPYSKNGTYPPPTVVGETYNINAVGIAATATIPAKVKLGTYPAGGVVTIP